MSLPEPMPSLSSRLAALTQRLGLTGRAARHILERAHALRLPFQALPAVSDSIWWQASPPLQWLVDLPRGALSGPVQEDKAMAHAALVRVVEQSQSHLDAIDLRQIDGLGGGTADSPACRTLEDYAATQACRSVRIISYKDFLRAIGQPLPGFSSGEPIALRQATWRGERLFWAGEHHGEAFACAIVYARRRGLEISLPAELTRYRLSEEGLNALRLNYHALAMPVQSWNDPGFMGLLLDNGLPYARLSLLRTPGAPEVLLLPRQNPEANALGEGLHLAGAADVIAYLKTLL